MKELKARDTLVIWRLDRLGRSLKHLIEIVEELKGRGVGFRSISDGGIDTTTASGEMVFNIFATLAQFERRLIQERTQVGLKAARARGKNGGRQKISPDNPKVQMARKMNKNLSFSVG
jgi:DNA invertase Pin-like site-specific DNA recombinase